MRKKLKEIIESAPQTKSGTFDEFLIVPSGEQYDGFWGRNGFNNIILLAKRREEATFNILTNYSDVFVLLNIHSVNIDIPTELNCVRVFLDKPIKIHDVTSSVIGYGGEEL